MAQFSVNGTPLQGRIYELKTDQQQIPEVKKAGQDDGLDQVYFEANGKNYVIEGDGMDLSALNSGNGMAWAHLNLDGEKIPAQILDYDNEVNTAGEGLKSLQNWVGGAFFGTVALGEGALWLSSRKVAQQSLSQQGALIGQGLTQASHLGKLPISMTTQTGLPAGIGSELVRKAASSQSFTAINHKTSHALVLAKELPKVSGGVKAAQGAVSGAQTTLKSAQTGWSPATKVMAVGLAVAGAVAGGAALYGGLRGEDSTSLAAFKGEEVQ